MLAIDIKWQDDNVVDYWHCDNCGNTWMDYDDDFCPECKSLNCSFDELEISEIKKIEESRGER